MSKKLQNIKALQQMMEGTHKFQTKKTVGFADTAKLELRQPGDIWEETDANGNVYIYEQKDGFRIKRSKNSGAFQQARTALQTFTNCRKDKCTCINPTHLDEKMRKFNAMCYDCTIEMEHELRKSGKYAEYERERVKQNALAWLASAEKDLELLKKAYTQASEYVINSAGETEHWSAQMTPEEFHEKIEKGFEQFKMRFIDRIQGTENENN